MHRHRRLAALALAVAVAVPLVAAAPAAPAGPRVAAALPLAGIVIEIDPGHNGGNASHPSIINRLVWIGNRWKACDTVGTSTAAGFPEHRFTWIVAGVVRAQLQALGATVVLSRSSDTGVGPCINVRARLAGTVHARLKVSIHADGAPSADHGFFVMRPGLVPGYTNGIVTSSLSLARAVRAGLVRAGVPIANYYATGGLIARTDLGGLNLSPVPAVMVELGNMRNAADAARMLNTGWRVRYASGLVAGIRLFLGR